MTPRRYRLGLLAAAFIALLVASLIDYAGTDKRAPSWFMDSHTWVGLFRECGIAFFIALVILFTVEENSKAEARRELDEQRQAIKRDVFEAIFAINLPKEVRDAVQKSVLSKKFFRTKSLANYEVEPKDFELLDGSVVKGVILMAHYSFVIRNLSSSKEEYPFEAFVEKPSLANLKDPWREVNIQSVSINGKLLTKKEIDEADAKAPDDAAKRLIQIIPINANEEVSVDFSFSAVRGYDDSEFWVTKLPNDGMTLRVKMPKGVDTFGVFPVHDTPLVATHRSPETGFFGWELRDTVLPNQGVMLWWRLSDAGRGEHNGGNVEAAKP